MIFNSDVFLFVFFPLVFGIFWWLDTKRARQVLMAIAGYVFYGWWNPKYCLLLLFSSVVSYTAGLLLSDPRWAHRRRLIVAAAVTSDLTVLGFFKYYDFLAESLRAVWTSAPVPLIDVILPIGISFYTFHTISYVVDVSAGRVRATRDLWEYLTYVNLFSQLVAGPIVRFRQIEGDLDHIDGPPREDWIARGLGFFAVGLVKKVIIADSVAAIVNPILGHWHTMSFTEGWIAALGYATQLYFDFSGYSDMAVGLGFLFGLRIPQNFNAPYRSLGITDFWRRWHISLSTWLRDYLYIPLGGNRKGPLRTHVNLMIVMLLGGLWHGAAWTFVVWGGYHGVLLILDRLAKPRLSRLPPNAYRLLTFFLVVNGWVFFRATTFPMAFHWFQTLYHPIGVSLAGLKKELLVVALTLAAVATVPETFDLKFGRSRRAAVLYAGLFVLAYLFMNGRESVFLYYQF